MSGAGSGCGGGDGDGGSACARRCAARRGDERPSGAIVQSILRSRILAEALIS